MEDNFWNEMIEEDQEAYDKSILEWQESEKKENEKIKKILELVKSKVSNGAYEEILYEIEVSEYTYEYLITDKPKGEFQDCNDFEYLEGIWVDQITNGGYTGDEFAGTVSIKISENEYLQFSYSM